MSPLTSSATGFTTIWPSRFTGTVAVICDLSASSDCFALCSSWKPMSALRRSMSPMMVSMSHSLVTPESTRAISSMIGIIPQNCLPSM